MLLQVSHVCAEIVPERGALDARVRTAVYEADQIYQLDALVGYQIELEFQVGERFAGQGGGDLEGIAIGAFENHVMLKPRAQDVSTNLVIYTDRRAYRFDYQVHAQAPDGSTDEVMYVVRFIYPQDQREGEVRARTAAAMDESLARSVAPHNDAYAFCGDRALKPTSAFDDGVHTYVAFGARSELPAFFVLNEDDSESLVNFNVEAGTVVIHRVARRFVVRRGRLTGCIVNQAFAGAGRRLDSGTVTPKVVRERSAP
jgi:type IV secretion system protein VirB9